MQTLFPESNVRAEPIPPRTIPTAVSTPTPTLIDTPHSALANSITPTPTALAPARIGRAYDAHTPVIPHEVAPGIMSDGTMSSNHPLVHQFLDHISEKFLTTESACTSMGSHTSPAWHKAHKHSAVTWWRVEYGGVALVEDAVAVLGPAATRRVVRAVFALAALAVFARWTHPAHWAFWAKGAKVRTAAVVHEVVRADPKEIFVPNEVAWVDEQTAMRVLGNWHGGWFIINDNPRRYIPHPDKEPKEKVSKAAKSGKSDGESKNANGKRTIAEDGSSVPSKKRRTQDNTETAPLRRSTRVRKGAAAEPAPDPMPDATSTSTPLQATAELASNESEDMVLDIQSVEPVVAVQPVASVEPFMATEPVASVEPVTPVEAVASIEPIASMDQVSSVKAGSEGQAQEPSIIQSTVKARAKPRRTRRTKIGMKRKGSRKQRAPSTRDAPSEQPLPAPAPPTESSARCTIRIPARVVPVSATSPPATDKATDEVSAHPASGETTAVESRESTAVGTPFSGPSTHVGTPPQELEVKLELVVAEAKVVREIPAPVRTSARIRAKNQAAATQQ